MENMGPKDEPPFDEFESEPEFCKLGYDFRIPDNLTEIVSGNGTTITVKGNDS